MAQPLDTTGYDDVVLIDSQVVLEGRPLNQLPWGDLFQGSVLLLVPRQVQTEIDRRKNDGRLGKRARAFNKLLDGFIVDRIPSPVVAQPRIDVATVANRPIDWSALDDLDKEDPDDRVVAQALNALVDDPARIVLLSHDMRPRDAAATHGLGAVKLPETWLRDPEPSPDQRRIAELEARNRLLSADQPRLEVRLETVTPEPWHYRQIGEAAAEQVDGLLHRLLATAPRQSRGGPFDMGLATYDHSLDERLEKWAAALRKDLPIMHRGLARLHAQHRVRIVVENVGPIPAEGLSLEIRSGNAVLHGDPYWVLFTGTGAPQPRLLHHHLTGFNPRDLVPSRREPFSFYWDERGPGDHLILSCASFRQEKSHAVEISVELLADSLPKVQLEAVVTASNMKGDARGRLLVGATSVATPIDDVYDFGQDVLKLRPPFQPTDEVRADDLTWFRNGGEEHDRD